jgi:hypothetical protein
MQRGLRGGVFLRGGVGEGTISLRWGSLSGADPLSRPGCTSSSGEPLPMRRALRSDHAEFAENEARFVLPRESVESAGRVLAQ